MIPKKIHYCWFGKNEMPDLAKRCIETWHKYLPDYEFKLWNENNSPMEIPFVKDAYKHKMYAYVSDYVRFYALYKEGGIYLDVDMEVIKSFDPLLNNKMFLGAESKRHIGVSIIGAEKNHQFIEKFLKYLENLKFYKALPWILEMYIKENYGSNENFSKSENITIYPPEYFYPYNPWLRSYPSLMYDDITENTYAIHHWQKSWKIPRKVKLRNKLYKILNLIKKK